ncbi:hypothetical protein JCM11641_001741 [Rhodosporidiobolus odoratus]
MQQAASAVHDRLDAARRNQQSRTEMTDTEIAQARVRLMDGKELLKLVEKWLFVPENELAGWERIAAPDVWPLLGKDMQNQLLQHYAQALGKRERENRGEGGTEATHSGPTTDPAASMRALGKTSRFSASELYGTGRRMRIYGRLPSTAAEGW